MSRASGFREAGKGAIIREVMRQSGTGYLIFWFLFDGSV